MSSVQLFVAVALIWTSVVVAQIPLYNQCGGMYYTGSTICVQGATCKYVNMWYSQCVLSSVTTTTTKTSPIVTTTATSSQSPSPSSISSNTLDGRMKAKGKKYWGNLLDRSTINNTIVTNILKTEFGQITAENSMTWEATEPSKGIFSFSLADPIVNFAKSNGKLLRGHALVWHAQLPAWMTVINNRTILTNAVETHITTVMSRWKGDIYAWDVCNEILNEDGTLRNSPFSKYIGESFVSIAFTAARKADPNAKLYINDYNLDSVSSAKVLSIVNLVKNWRLAGVSIDGIGSSTHLSAGLGAGVQAALTYLATAGVEVAITELDIANAGPTDYSNVVKACLAVSQCVGITSWGVRDSDSFAFNNGLMYDANGNKKPAYDAALAALS